MSLEGFQLIDNEPIVNSIKKRDYLKIYHQQRAQLNDPNQNIEFIFRENIIYHQIGNSYLQFDITAQDPTAGFNADAEIRLVENAFAYCSKEGVISTTGGMEIENIKLLGQVSTFMRSLTSKNEDLLSHFDKCNDGDTNVAINNTSLKQMLIDNHTLPVSRGKLKGQLPLEHIFGSCKTFKKITKNLGFHITLKTNDLQNITFTTIANDVKVTINSLHLFVPIMTPNTDIQVMFIESIENNYTITYDSWYTKRKIVTDGNEFQVDISSSQTTKSPKYLIAAHQTEARIGTANKGNTVAVFDHVGVKKYFAEIDRFRYPKETVLTNFAKNDYLDQYRDLKLFYKYNVGEN